MGSEQENFLAIIDAKTDIVDVKKVQTEEAISIDFLSTRGAISNIIESKDENYVFSMKDEEYEFKLHLPIFVTRIKVALSEFDSVKGMRLIANDLLAKKLGKVAITVENVNGNTVSFKVDKVITSFSLHRGKTPFTKKLKQLQVFGIYPSDFEKFESNFIDLQDVKNDILKLTENRSVLIAEQASKLEKNTNAANENVLKKTEELRVLNKDL